MMFANVLKRKGAIDVSTRIIDIFIMLHENLTNKNECRFEIEEKKKQLHNQDKNLEPVFQYLDELLEKKENTVARKEIGYKMSNKQSPKAAYLAWSKSVNFD